MNKKWGKLSLFAGAGFFCFSLTLFAQDLEFHYASGMSRQKIYLVSELTGWRADSRMLFHETKKGQYTLAIAQPWLMRLEYKFLIDGQWASDPGNPKHSPDGYGGFNSYRDLLFQEDPELLPGLNTPRWERSKILVEDLEGAQRDVYLTSPEFKKDGKPKAVVYFQDGVDYLDRAEVEVLLANLSARKDMPFLYGVFVPPKDRENEYGLTPRSDFYVEFLTRRVVPFAEKALGIRKNEAKRLLIGPSLGGVITLYTAFKHPEIFPYAASQSGAMDERKEVLFDLIKQSPFGKPEKLFLEIGIYEPSDWIRFTRDAKAAVSLIGVPMKYQEYPSTHDWLGWRNRLGEIMRYFFIVNQRIKK